MFFVVVVVFVVVCVVVCFILSRLLYLAFSANLGLLCMPHPGMGPLVYRPFRTTLVRPCILQGHVHPCTMIYLPTVLEITEGELDLNELFFTIHFPKLITHLGSLRSVPSICFCQVYIHALSSKRIVGIAFTPTNVSCIPCFCS